MRRLLFTALCLVALAGTARTRTTQPNLTTAAIVLDNIADAAVDSTTTDGVNQADVTLRGFNKRAADSKESFLVTKSSRR